MSFKRNAAQIAERLEDIPTQWRARQAILDMRAAGFPHWRQMEWMGWYFQFLCSAQLPPLVQIPGPRYGKVTFDGFMDIPWDFKAHAINTRAHKVIVNDSQATADAIRDYAEVGLVLARGTAVYNDEERTFQKWHDALKGGKSAYELDRIARGTWSRIRKASFRLQQISFIRIRDDTLVKCRSFQEGFRNAGGTARRQKVLIDLEEDYAQPMYSVEL